MTDTKTLYAQLKDHIAGTLYDQANDGEPSDGELYKVFEGIADSLLNSFDVRFVNEAPLVAQIAIRR